MFAVEMDLRGKQWDEPERQTELTGELNATSDGAKSDIAANAGGRCQAVVWTGFTATRTKKAGPR
jgi:hypothetical protein